MGASDIISLIVQVGYPVAVKLIDKVFTKSPVTQADWDSIKADAAQTAKDRMKAQLVAAGIALDSPQAVALLGMT